jgi:hypothetical protein
LLPLSLLQPTPAPYGAPKESYEPKEYEPKESYEPKEYEPKESYEPKAYEPKAPYGGN